MNHCHVRTPHTPPRRWPAGCLIALAVACLAAQPVAVQAREATRPSVPAVPAGLDVPSTHRLYLVGHAVGTQNYVCIQRATGEFVWSAFGPQATLFSDCAAQVATHFLSANPDEGGTLRPSWQDSRDTSAVWARPIASSDDPAWVEAGAVPWLLLEVVGASPGPNGGRRLVETTYIQRVHTSGGVAPTDGCAEPANIGARALVPYATDYYFYRGATGRGGPAD